MAKWRDQLLTGSYKKVPFKIDSHEFSGGKRVVDHLFPYRDLAFTESLGKKQRAFNIDGYVIGDDYFKARDLLITALESDGAGKLVHPYLGTKTVELIDFSVSESKADGGVVYFSMQFHETSAKPSADFSVDPIAAAAALDEKIDQSLIEKFKKFSASAFSDVNLDRLTAMVDAGIDAIYATRNLIPAGDFGISQLAFAVGQAKQGVRSLILRPIELSSFVVSSSRLLKKTISLSDFGVTDSQGRDLLKDPRAFNEAVFGARKKRAALKSAVDVKSRFATYEGDTEQKIQLRENQRLYGNLIKGSFLSKLVGLSIETVYGSYQEALEHREYLIAEIEELLSDPLIDDETYQLFQDLMVIAVEGIPGEFTSEARLSTITLSSPLPSLVIAHDLYDSLQLESDLISRNRIKNPAFFRPGKIEVIAGD